ncbi:MAG: GyrI-like domain-containing protein [Saprospiraceae bacterium]
MQPRIEIISEKIFAGKRMSMSFSNDSTTLLWQSFMPNRHQIASKIGTNLYSIELFPNDYFDHFNPDALFTKWAAVEIEENTNVASGMELLLCPAGKYAVFVHKGLASEGERTYRYIYETWLPSTNYAVDQRPHFAVMGEKYKHGDPESEEEIWIPIIEKEFKLIEYLIRK